MNKRSFILFLLLVLVIFVSGCNGGDTRTEVVSTDMLVIEDIHAIPSQVVRDGDTIVIRMDVTNVGQNDVWMFVDDSGGVRGDFVLVNFCDGMYELQDKGFDIISVSGPKCSTPEDDFEVEISGKVLENPCYVKFVPEQTHVFQWTIDAPSKDKLHGLTSECTFNFQTIYAGVAETITYVYFAIPHEVAQRIYTKNDLTLVGDNVASYGPVVANFETGEAQPIRAGGEDTWTVYLNLKNLGNGVAKIRSIELDVDRAESGISSMGSSLCEISYWDVETGAYYLSADLFDKYLEGDVTASGKRYFDDYISGTGCGTEPNVGGPVFQGYFTLNSYVCCNNLDIGGSDDFPERCKKRGCSKLDGWEKESCNKYSTLRNKLEIFERESSRIGCTMKVPEDINIMQPYKFVTRAKYAYSQGMDLKIKTQPMP